MSKFNSTAATESKTTNLAGGEAFKMTPELELVSALLTSFLEDKYYETGKTRQTRIEDLIKNVDPLFAAKAAIYARTEFGMRSVSHVVAGTIAGTVKGQEWTKRFFDKIVYRPDDMMEILSYYYDNYSKNEPQALRKGFSKAFTRFNEYQLAKYRGEGKSVKLVDIVNVVHPAHSEAIRKLVNDELRNTDTFEAKLSQAGKSADENAKGAAWGELIKSGKIGYMALVKNLRNIVQDSPESIDAAVELLTNEKKIKGSLLLPFRFMTAYQELQNIQGSSKILGGLSKALDISFANVPQFEGKTAVIVDHSGSMGSGFGSNFIKGAMFGIGLARSSGADLLHFGDTTEYLSFNPADTTMTLVKWLDSLNQGGYGYYENGPGTKGNVGHATNFASIFQTLNDRYDRIVIISDMQGWVGHNVPSSPLSAYRNKFNANPYLYSWDISGYGTLQFPEQRVATLSGWNEKVFDIMKLVETDKKALVNKINAIDL